MGSQKEKKEEGINTSFIDFEKAPYSKGNEHIETLLEAIKSQTVVEVLYQKFQETKPDVRVISPLLLKEHRNRWYLLGIIHEGEKIRTFGLDRIDGVLPRAEVTYISSPSFDANLYFRRTIGIILDNGKAEEVILSFTPFQGKYIKTQHLHATQQVITDNEQELRIRMKVVLNYELISTVLSFGETVKVISPPELRDKIVEKLAKSHKAYGVV